MSKIKREIVLGLPSKENMAAAASLRPNPTLNLQPNPPNIRTIPPQQTPLTNNNLSHNYNKNHNHNNGSFNSKKRSLDHVARFENSPYFKIRAFVDELRPLIIKVAESPKFDTCEDHHGIQEKINLIMEQCRQQTTSPTNSTDNKKPTEQKPSVGHSSQEKRIPVACNLVKQTRENQCIPGSYIVGGSAFGWNFLMFQGTKPEYYGRTKEAFRAWK